MNADGILSAAYEGKMGVEASYFEAKLVKVGLGEYVRVE